jgi:predicted DNA-binding protein (UPF0251 family)
MDPHSELIVILHTFQNQSITASSLEEVFLSLDEYEAIRLADLDGLYQEQAAVMMNISRQTFGRVIESAHRKVADVLVNGKALKIEVGRLISPRKSPIVDLDQ